MKFHKIKHKIASKIILNLYFNSWRIFIYKNIYKYDIGKNVKIGRSLINSEIVFIGDNSTIGNNNHISCKTFKMGNDSKIISKNRIIGKSNFSIGNNSRIISDHYIDCWNDVGIGNHTWLAGIGSQIWTHGSLHTKTGKKLDVKLGNGIYIGSGCCIAPGVSIKDDCLIGLGSVITTSFDTENCLIAGNPAKLVKAEINWRKNW